jgi:RNA 2',3'-cyclic 3'-phosphodiesterase
VARTLAHVAQMSFPDFGPLRVDLGSAVAVTAATAASQRDNFLFAIYPPQNVAMCIHHFAASLREQHAPQANLRPTTVLHATLCLLKDAHCVEAALHIGDGIALTAFEVAFDRVLSFDRRNQHNKGPQKYPTVLSCEPGSNCALHRLQQRLRASLAQQRLLAERGFTPHITLLYDVNKISRRSVAPIQWRVNEFLLVHSHFGETRHETIRRWILPSPTAH